MSRILRPARGLSRFEVSRARDSARSFTTTQFFAEDEKAPRRPTHEQRSERTSKEVSDLLGRAAQRKNGPAPARLGGGTRGKVLNLQSLPRRGARGGGLGIFRNLGRGGMGGGMGRPGGSRGGGGGVGSGRGRGGGRRKKKTDEETENDQNYLARREAKANANLDLETPEDREARMIQEVGVKTQYNPTTSLGSLTPFLPDVPADSNALGRLATALANMRELTGGYIDDNPVVHGKDLYRQFKQDGIIYFTDLRARKAVERQGEVGAPDDAVKNTITKRAVMGEYDAVQRPDVKDPLTMARNALAKSAGYNRPKVEAFEAKLAEMVAKGKTRQAKVKGTAEKPQENRGEKKGKAKA